MFGIRHISGDWNAIDVHTSGYWWPNFIPESRSWHGFWQYYDI